MHVGIYMTAYEGGALKVTIIKVINRIGDPR